MRLETISLKNFRAFKRLPTARFSGMSAVVGKNDVGKSCILYALDIFFGNRKPVASDFYRKSRQFEIAASFLNFPPAIEVDGEMLNFANENLLDRFGHFSISLECNLQPDGKIQSKFFVNAFDFDHIDFNRLAGKAIKEFKEICGRHEIIVGTNLERKNALRLAAAQAGIHKKLQRMEMPKEFWNIASKFFPTYSLFVADEKIGVGETTFQNQFQALVEQAVENQVITPKRKAIEKHISRELTVEFDQIYGKLKKYTTTIRKLVPKPKFLWKTLVKFDLEGEDESGVSVSLENRGSGVRRLLMVAFFQYQADKTWASDDTFKDMIFAVEEPEVFLHPGAQRDLLGAFLDISESPNHQVLITTHSPVFAGTVEKDGLILIERSKGRASILQGDELDLNQVAKELGIQASDRLYGYSGCIFVEGPTDIVIMHSLAKTLKSSGHITHTFEDKRIGIVLIGGGGSLKYYVERKAFSNLSPNKYGVILDSDKVDSGSVIPGKKVKLQKEAEKEGALFFFTRRREIENYLHPDVVFRKHNVQLTWANYDDVEKSLKGIVGSKEKISELFAEMTSDEILEMDKYTDTQGREHHEILEIIQEFLTIVP